MAVILAVSITVFAGCTPSTRQVTTRQVMNSWMGSHISELIRSWGPPQQIVTDGAGGKIYIWSWQVTAPPPIVPPPTQTDSITTQTRGEMRYNPLTRKYEWVEVTQQVKPQTVPSLPTVLSEVSQRRLEAAQKRAAQQPRVRMFYVRQNGIIYYWRSEG